YRLAQATRAAADRLHEQVAGRPGRVWFLGHWGVQYYVQENGDTVIDLRHFRATPGDLVVRPENNFSYFPFDPDKFREIATVSEKVFPWLSRMRLSSAGFYTCLWGPLPFAVEAVPDETYHLLKVTEPFHVRGGW